MGINALNCDDCGGAIAAPVGKLGAECPFCGSTQTHSKPLDEQIEAPESVLPFVVDNSGANISFKSFANSKFWAPGEIKNASLELNKLFLPAWIWNGTVESHYSGLKSAMTRSAKRPFSGKARDRITQALVPASQGVTLNELNAIRPFESEHTAAFDNEELEHPYELGSLSREAALQQGMMIMKTRHRSMIQSRESSISLNNSCLFEDLEGKPSLLPIFIGVYRHKERPYRIIVNGLNGNVTGTYPISWVKVVIAILIFLGVVGGFFAAVSA